MDVFSFTKSGPFINHCLKGNRSRAPRGSLSQLALAMGCHVTYLAQILRDERLCSLEQGMRFCEWRGLTDLETAYFINLLSYERAGTESLRQFFREALAKLEQKAKKVSEQVKTKPLAAGSPYFSDLRLQLVHAMVQLSRLESIEQLSTFAGWSVDTIEECLALLKSMGLVEETFPGKWRSLQDFVHIDRSQNGYRDFYLAWRTYINGRFILRSQQQKSYDFNMASLIITNDKTAQEIQRLFMDVIKDLAPQVKRSPSEQMFFLGLDFMPISHPL